MSALQVASILAEAYCQIPPKTFREVYRIEAERRDEVQEVAKRAIFRLSQIPVEERHERAWIAGIEAADELRRTCRMTRGSTLKKPVVHALEKVAGAMSLCLIYYTIEEAD